MLFHHRGQHRVPLSGHFFYQPPNPGLKPWAVLYSRFAAKSDSSLRDGISLPRFQAEILPGWLRSSFPCGTDPPTRLPNKPGSGSEAAQAGQRSGPRPDKESKPTDDPNLISEQLPWVPTETCSSRIGPDRSRSSRPALHWKARMPLHMLRRPVTRFGSLRRTQDTDRLWALASLNVTLTQSLARNS
jgi:hypothetical protein